MKKFILFLFINANIYGNAIDNIKDYIFKELEMVNYELDDLKTLNNYKNHKLFLHLCGQKQAYEHCLEIIYFEEKYLGNKF